VDFVNIEIVPAGEADLPTVRNLARFYIYDMSEFMGWPCPESGSFEGCDEFFGDWEDGKNSPYVIRVDGELAGFAGIKRDEGVRGGYLVQEFFILRKYRRRGVGRDVATRLFDRFPGMWKVQQIVQNSPAVAFWREVIRGYTKGHFDESTERDPRWGDVNVIRFSNA